MKTVALKDPNTGLFTMMQLTGFGSISADDRSQYGTRVSLGNVKTSLDLKETRIGSLESDKIVKDTKIQNLEDSATGIATNASNIATNTTNIATNASNIALNATDISALQTKTTPVDSYSETTYTNGLVTGISTWSTSSKTNLVQTKSFTYTNGLLTEIEIADGSNVTELTTTFTYDSNGNLESITKDYA